MQAEANLHSEENVAAGLPVVTIELAQYIAGDSFEYVLSEALENQIESALEPRICVLDFQETIWIDIASTQLITTFYLAARKKNWLVLLRPPRSKEVRDFWRFWRFPEAFEVATNTAFSRLITGPDREKLNEPQTTYNERSVLQVHDALDPDTSRSLNFFGFVSDTILGSNLASVASTQADRWTSSDVQDVLEKYVGGRCDYIPTRVVFEAVFNATKHPGATLIQSASYHDRFARQKSSSRKRTRDSDFVLFFWDNGQSILSTVISALKGGVNIKQHYADDFTKNYLVTYKGKNGSGNYESVFSSEIEINEKTPDEIKLLSTIFAGVSTKPDPTFAHEVHPEVSGFDARFARRGMGLFVLINAVVEVLDGSVAFRSGNHYMNISKIKPLTSKKTGAQLRVKIVETDDALPEFEGNMIVIRIPTEKAGNEELDSPDPI